MAEAARPSPQQHIRVLLALALIAASLVAACGVIRPATTPPTYGHFKDSGGA